MFTKLMTKIFSESEEYQAKISEKLDEAKRNGSAELVDDENNLQFADVGDEVIVEDRDNDEVTSFKENPDDENDIVMKKVETEVKDEPESVPEEKLNSETQPDVEVERVEGKDGDHVTETVPDVEVEVVDSKTMSDKFDNAIKKFSEIADRIDEAVKKLEDQGEALSDASEGNDKKLAEEIVVKSNKMYAIHEMAKEFSDVRIAKKLKTYCDEMSADIAKAKESGIDVSDVESKVAEFSADADEIIAKDEEKVEETPVSEVTKEDEAPASVEVTEEVVEPVNPEPEVKSDEVELEEAKKSFSQVLSSRFDDCSVAPRQTIEGDRTFSTKDEKKSINPFLTTLFE